MGLLREAGVTSLVDVRTIPRSRTNPQFNGDTLPATLAGHAIGYTHIRELGGLRGRKKSAAASLNDFWENASFRNYADYTASDAFHDGLARLIDIAEHRPTAIMCAEAVWWRCHRRIIADYLLTGGACVLHIMGPGKITPATLNPAARPGTGNSLIYPA